MRSERGDRMVKAVVFAKRPAVREAAVHWGEERRKKANRYPQIKMLRTYWAGVETGNRVTSGSKFAQADFT
jgi:hypothetical protein